MSVIESDNRFGLSDEHLLAIAELKHEHRTLNKARDRLDRKDWFLIEATFNEEAWANYRAAAGQYRKEYAEWRARIRHIPKADLNIYEQLGPLRPSRPRVFADLDLISDDALPTHLHLEYTQDGSEHLAVRSEMFDWIEKQDHIQSLKIIDRGDQVDSLVQGALAVRKQELTATLENGPPDPRPQLYLVRSSEKPRLG